MQKQYNIISFTFNGFLCCPANIYLSIKNIPGLSAHKKLVWMTLISFSSQSYHLYQPYTVIFTLALITTKLWFAGIVNILCVLYNDTLPPFSYINCTNLYRHRSYKNLLTRFQLCLRDHNHHHLAIFFVVFFACLSFF